MSALSRKLAAEFVGTALLANSLATGAVLFALISAMGSISGAHFNPVVTLAEAWHGKLPSRLED